MEVERCTLELDWQGPHNDWNEAAIVGAGEDLMLVVRDTTIKVRRQQRAACMPVCMR